MSERGQRYSLHATERAEAMLANKMSFQENRISYYIVFIFIPMCLYLHACDYRVPVSFITCHLCAISVKIMVLTSCPFKAG